MDVFSALKKYAAGILTGSLILAGTLYRCSIAGYAIDNFQVGDTMTSNDPVSWDKHFCIDSYELLGLKGGQLGGYELYQYVVPSSRLSEQEEAYLFWATVGLYYGKNLDRNVSSFAERCRSAGLGITAVSADDMKKIMHSSAVKAKYPWIQTAVSNAETYMRAAGVLEGSESTVSGKEIPGCLAGATSAASAAAVDRETLQLPVQPGELEFLQTVPMKYSVDGGGSFSDTVPNGWIVQKTAEGVSFFNPNPGAGGLMVKFTVSGTPYASGNGVYSSVQDVYDRCLQLWVCCQCHGAHKASQAVLPLEWHQRFTRMEMNAPMQEYYVLVNGTAAGGNSSVPEGVPGAASGDMNFKIYRHAEDYKSTYRTQLTKYDHETGQTMEGAAFAVYERFDDQEEINTRQDGPAQLYLGGSEYQSGYRDDPVLWEDFRRIGSVTTDQDGYASFCQEHVYHYDKTFCDGHPAPSFVEIPEQEENEEGEVENEDEIEAAKEENRRLAELWISVFSVCQARSESSDYLGVHFHWIMPEVSESEVRAIAGSGGEEGSVPDAGVTDSADGDRAYSDSGCQQDNEESYDRFIHLKYSYTFAEITAREGYILHDQHSDDVPIEIVTGDSSEAGANAGFGNGYSKDIRISDRTGAEYGSLKSEISFSQRNREEGGLFGSAYTAAVNGESCGSMIDPGPTENYLHCNGTDDETTENMWRIYDHRTEGEIHINKRDMELQNGETGEYHSYGDTQGDGTLEGAVYGLFAAEDLIHPDGKTGIVYKANQLTAVAATDRDGNASFPVFTEAPGCFYNYASGKIEKTPDGWYDQAPKNLYQQEHFENDYTEDGIWVTQTGMKERTYPDYAAQNGNCWIGRPLLLGAYYVKELTRSEGYELSIGERQNPVTNRNQDPDAAVESGNGSVSVTTGLWADLQEVSEPDGTYGKPLGNELFFSVRSQGTGSEGFDLLLNQLPEGTRLYRLDSAIKETEMEIGTGEYEAVPMTDDDGNPIYVIAESDTEYPKYDSDGSFLMRKRIQDGFIRKSNRKKNMALDPTATEKALRREMDGMSGEELNAYYQKLYEESDEAFMKAKLEEALRANGWTTPYEKENMRRYSSVSEPVYNPGMEETYGYPLVQVEVDEDDLSVGNMIFSILDWYHTHSYYNFGGIHSVEESENGYLITMYAGRTASFVGFMTQVEGQNVYFKTLYDDDSNRMVYAIYTSDGNALSDDTEAFGRYEESSEGADDSWVRLIPDAKFDVESGEIEAVMIEENEYYQTGEIPEDAYGNPIQKLDYQEKTERIQAKREEYVWVEIPFDSNAEPMVAHVESCYNDAYGASYDDEEGLECRYRVVLPDPVRYISAEDLVKAGANPLLWKIGDEVASGIAALICDKAGIKAYQDYQKQTLGGDSSYIRTMTLTYPGQDSVYQDGSSIPGDGTRKNPLLVQERAVKEQFQVVKKVITDEGIFTEMNRFRFKIYLKSNLEDLYRSPEGTVVWLDRNDETVYGSSQQQIEYNDIYPELVRKINTQKGMEGHTRILETIMRKLETPQETTWISAYNYDKFFDAIAAANHDRWDDEAPSFTSYRPLGNLFGDTVNRTENTVDNTEVSDAVRQFAIDWYLDEEVQIRQEYTGTGTDERQCAGGMVRYADELYDDALHAAIQKAKDYLIPFFLYDLDEIYAVKWDSEDDGGADDDYSTLAANSLWDSPEGERYCYGISEYLPYGAYVVVEQQPMYSGDEYQRQNLNDFRNKHYLIDCPKEVELPRVYEDYPGSQKSPELLNRYYQYDADMQMDEMERKFQIRFCEENHVILAHNANGDFKIYKYGVNRELAGVLDQERKCESRSEVAGMSDPLDYPETVRTMRGIQTAYDGKFASMLVPWSIRASLGKTEERLDYVNADSGESQYCGFNYAKFCNRFYTAKLRIEKLDSETHENILHDGAVFSIYKAECDEREDGSGKVRFYEEDTMIYGTEGFLCSMRAEDIRPMVRRIAFQDQVTGKLIGMDQLYTGIVPAGTPVCRESEKIVQGDCFGKQTAVMKAYSTVRDGMIREERSGADLSYEYQTTGYLVTPQPLGAGTYVIVEDQVPEGYVRSKPVAVEVYSDKITYYKKGNRNQRVLAAIFEYDADHQTMHGTKPQDRVPAARIYMENVPITLSVEKKKESSIETAETTADKTVSYLVQGRVDGSWSEIGGNPDLVYAYERGQYLGYAWKKGTLEYLTAREEAGEQVEICYDGNVFAGYGYVTRVLETADDDNPYVTGAKMTLYEAIPVKKSGYDGDFRYQGVTVERDSANNVRRMYIKEGYAGEKTAYVEEQDENGDKYHIEYPSGKDSDGNTIMAQGSIWGAYSVKRPDTDILYYDLDGLEIYTDESINGTTRRFFFDRIHNRVSADRIECDKQNYQKTDTDFSIYGFKGGIPYLEFVGGDFSRIRYLESDKQIEMDPETKLYHLDEDGNRDALVDPGCGMAYVIDSTDCGNAMDSEEAILVWPVRIHRDQYGNVTAREKIRTWRLATVGENQNDGQEETGYLTGTWTGENDEQSHPDSTLIKNSEGENRNGVPITSENHESYKKEMNPVYDHHGLPVYYQRSGKVYKKGTDLYDRNGDFVRYQDSDGLESFNQNAYRLQEQPELMDTEGGDSSGILVPEAGQDQGRLYHRQGEGYILENTWTASEKTPNDPFHTEMMPGQADVLKRVPAGTYILQELEVPEGYQKAMPVGITVSETLQKQKCTMVDRTTKLEIAKINAPNHYEMEVNDMDQGSHWKKYPSAQENEVIEGVGSYTYGAVCGARLALFPAEKIYTDDYETYPKGYYLRKTSEIPVDYCITESTGVIDEIRHMEWITDEVPAYFEGIPHGDYILEELETPVGYVTADPVEITIDSNPAVQSVIVMNDHTKVEVEKFFVDKLGERKQLKGAEFALCVAEEDEEGNICLDEEGKPVWKEEIASFVTHTDDQYRGFAESFEEAYISHGTKLLRFDYMDEEGVSHSAEIAGMKVYMKAAVSGEEDRFPVRAIVSCRLEDGTTNRVHVYGESSSYAGDFSFEYQFDYHKQERIGQLAESYSTESGMVRINYLPAGKAYVLVEKVVPEGYIRAEPVLIRVENTKAIQQYHVENVEAKLQISKRKKDLCGELFGSAMELYLAADDGSLLMTADKLIHTWITGMDGRYTYQDLFAHRIPEGYRVGDLRLHTVTGLKSGIYWIVERKSPAYYGLAAPVSIEYDVEKEVKFAEVLNQPVTGDLSLRKTNWMGHALSGAEFELCMYRKPDMIRPIEQRKLICTDAELQLQELPVGEQATDGSVIPYVYTLRETKAPKGFRIRKEMIQWEFEQDDHGVSYKPGEGAKKEITVKNEETRLKFQKKCQGTEGDDEADAFVEGAHLAIHEITGRNEDGSPEYNPDEILEEWISSKEEKTHLVFGLEAGKEYLLIEMKEPEGWELMKPVIFRVSEDGYSFENGDDLLVVYNRKLPEVVKDEKPQPDIPKNPPEREDTNEIIVRKTGFLTAWYRKWSELDASQEYDGTEGRFYRRLRRILYRTGDEGQGRLVFAVTASGFLFILCYWFQKKM